MSYDAPDEPGNGGSERDRLPERLSPDTARRILDARFAAAGIQAAPGAELELDGTAVALDGYDQERSVGYLYYGADPDDAGRVDAAQAMSKAFTRLATSGQRHVLFIFQEDMPNSDVLERRIDAFFASLANSSR